VIGDMKNYRAPSYLLDVITVRGRSEETPALIFDLDKDGYRRLREVIRVMERGGVIKCDGTLYNIADITVTTKDSVLLDTVGLADDFVATVDVILKEVKHD